MLAQQPKLDTLALDIPIGLTKRGARDCDRAARSALGPRRSSVFPAPPRAVLEARSWEHACRICEDVEGKRISRQAWALVQKIREVDRALRQEPTRAGLGPRGSSGALLRDVEAALPWSTQKEDKAAGRDERLALVSRPLRRGRLRRAAGASSPCATSRTTTSLRRRSQLFWTAERDRARGGASTPRAAATGRLRDSPMQIVY